MSKHITYRNPIWYRNYRIYPHDNIGPHKWDFQHDDFDEGDNRYGHVNTIDEAIEQIDEMEE